MRKQILITPSTRKFTYDHQAISASVREMRRVYADKTDKQFIDWYQKKYRVPASTIKEILEASA